MLHFRGMCRLAAPLAMILLAACVDEPSTSGPPFDATVAVADKSWMDEDSSADEDICEFLPEHGACSLLCSFDELVESYVPDGTCVAFICDLTDGRSVTMHACRAI